jgi:polysaccharide biosynthesis protein PslH
MIETRTLQVMREAPFPPRTGSHKRAIGIASLLAEHGPVVGVAPPSRFSCSSSVPKPYSSFEFVERSTLLDFAMALGGTARCGSPRVGWSGRRAVSSRQLKRLIESAEFDLIVVEELLSVKGRSLNHDVNAPVVYSSHNVEAQLSYPYEASPRPVRAILRSLDRYALRRREVWLSTLADAIIATTEADALAFAAFGRPTLVIPNSSTKPEGLRPAWSDRTGLVVSGSLTWPPNLEGLRWFIRDVLPHLPSRVALPITVCSNSAVPNAERRALERAGVRIYVNLDDIDGMMSQHRVSAVPVHTGGGSRIRIPDAVALGMRVVSTTIGAEGQDHRVLKSVVVADAPQHFAQAIVDAHTDEPPEINLLEWNDWATQFGAFLDSLT